MAGCERVSEDAILILLYDELVFPTRLNAARVFPFLANDGHFFMGVSGLLRLAIVFFALVNSLVVVQSISMPANAFRRVVRHLIFGDSSCGSRIDAIHGSAVYGENGIPNRAFVVAVHRVRVVGFQDYPGGAVEVSQIDLTCGVEWEEGIQALGPSHISSATFQARISHSISNGLGFPSAFVNDHVMFIKARVGGQIPMVDNGHVPLYPRFLTRVTNALRVQLIFHVNQFAITLVFANPRWVSAYRRAPYHQLKSASQLVTWLSNERRPSIFFVNDLFRFFRSGLVGRILVHAYCVLVDRHPKQVNELHLRQRVSPTLRRHGMVGHAWRADFQFMLRATLVARSKSVICLFRGRVNALSTIVRVRPRINGHHVANNDIVAGRSYVKGASNEPSVGLRIIATYGGRMVASMRD